MPSFRCLVSAFTSLLINSVCIRFDSCNLGSCNEIKSFHFVNDEAPYSFPPKDCQNLDFSLGKDADLFLLPRVCSTSGDRVIDWCIRWICTRETSGLPSAHKNFKYTLVVTDCVDGIFASFKIVSFLHFCKWRKYCGLLKAVIVPCHHAIQYFCHSKKSLLLFFDQLWLAMCTQIIQTPVLLSELLTRITEMSDR